MQTNTRRSFRIWSLCRKSQFEQCCLSFIDSGQGDRSSLHLPIAKHWPRLVTTNPVDQPSPPLTATTLSQLRRCHASLHLVQDGFRTLALAVLTRGRFDGPLRFNVWMDRASFAQSELGRQYRHKVAYEIRLGSAGLLCVLFVVKVAFTPRFFHHENTPQLLILINDVVIIFH